MNEHNRDTDDLSKITFALGLCQEKQAERDWVNAFTRGDLVLRDYREFEEKFTRDFGDPYAKQHARLKWKELKQQDKQSVGDFNRYFNEITTLAEYDRMSDLTVGRYKSAIKEDIYQTIKGWAEKGDTLEWWQLSAEKVALEQKEEAAERGCKSSTEPRQGRVAGVRSKTPGPSWRRWE